MAMELKDLMMSPPTEEQKRKRVADFLEKQRIDSEKEMEQSRRDMEQTNQRIWNQQQNHRQMLIDVQVEAMRIIEAEKQRAAQPQNKAVVDDAGAEQAGIKAIQANSNEFGLSELLNTPAKKDDWFEVIDIMTKAFHLEHGVMPNKAQAWGRLSAVGLVGYVITVGTDKGEACLNMPGAKPLSRSAFFKRWAKYTANKAQ